MVKKTEIIADLEKDTVTVAYFASTDELRGQPRVFHGREVFLESVHFDEYLSYNGQICGAAVKNFRVLPTRYS